MGTLKRVEATRYFESGVMNGEPWFPAAFGIWMISDVSKFPRRHASKSARPSRASTRSPRVICSGALFKVTPPFGPRNERSKPHRVRVCKTLVKKEYESPRSSLIWRIGTYPVCSREAR